MKNSESRIPNSESLSGGSAVSRLPPMHKYLPLALFIASAAYAQDQQVGARTKAMGGSYTAFEDDPISVWLNPAGIATQADGMSISYQTATLYEVSVSPSGGNIPSPEAGWPD